ncbi:protein jag [Chloroflexota bacterium]
MEMEISGNRKDIIDVARDVLEELLSLMDIFADVMPAPRFPVGGEEEASSSTALNIEGEDLGILIGRRGQTLAALQHIVRLIVGYQTQTRLPLIIDVEGYKRRRCEGLQALAWRIAEQVKASKMSFSLEPMVAFERRVIHLTLANHPDVTTESTGQGEERKVVIQPRQQLA